MPSVGKVGVVLNERVVVYSSVEVEVCYGEKALTVHRAKKLLGWKEVTKATDKTSPELFALTGRHILLTNNMSNRWLTVSWLLTLRQEHLNRQWRANGETISIGKTGLVMSGQHRLIALILAELERNGPNGDYWRTIWKDELRMETILVFGIEEDDSTFRTLNRGKAGTFAEVLYRSGYFADMKPEDRKTCSRMTDFAVKLLWNRTGMRDMSYTSRRTHPEAMDFIARHPRVIKAVLFIHDLNQAEVDIDGRIGPAPVGQYIPPGTAAGLLYLMAGTLTDSEKYLDRVRSGTASERHMNLMRWEKACQFWELISSHSKEMEAVRYVYAFRGNEGAPLRIEEKIVVLSYAWLYFVNRKKIIAENITPRYATTDSGFTYISEWPNLGGIDLAYMDDGGDGVPADGRVIELRNMLQDEDLEYTAQSSHPELLDPMKGGYVPSEEEIAKAKEAIRQAKIAREKLRLKEQRKRK